MAFWSAPLPSMEPNAPPTAGATEESLRRLQADVEAMRRRHEGQLARERALGRREAVEALLPALDGTERALAMLPDDSEEIAEGLAALRSQFEAAFSTIGVERVPAFVGGVFDPACHEAVEARAVEGTGAGLILLERRAGYRDAAGLIRPAQVVVSVGNPASAGSADSAGTEVSP